MSIKPVFEPDRMEALKALFTPALCGPGQKLLRRYAQQFAPESYKGGDWSYYRLVAPGFECGGYAAPAAPATYCIVVPCKRYAGEMSSDAAGVLFTLFALLELAATDRGMGNSEAAEFLTMNYHDLRSYVSNHAEYPAIAAALEGPEANATKHLPRPQADWFTNVLIQNCARN